jgi:hypothetical protein
MRQRLLFLARTPVFGQPLWMLLSGLLLLWLLAWFSCARGRQ